MKLTPGVDTLLGKHAGWLQGKRVGLVSHAAAVDARGRSSAERLHQAPGIELTALFGPEHGFDGIAAAGELTTDGLHPSWGIPVFSLYGETRKPTPAMLDAVDILVVEFQDLGARPYTYASTLRLVLESAAGAGKPVIVADRPVPLPLGADGPLLDPAFESFVGFIPGPMQTGLTPGETARWLVKILGLNLDLRVAEMEGYHREAERQPAWPPWVPPSPRIRSWESACLFTTTVFGEALPALDYGSGTGLSFQLIGAPWLDPLRLNGSLDGIDLVPTRYTAKSGLYAGQELDGARLVISDYAAFKPVETSVKLLAAIRDLYGPAALWEVPGTRPEWFDKLYGTDTVRLALQGGVPADAIIASWQPGLAAFMAETLEHRLYRR